MTFHAVRNMPFFFQPGNSRKRILKGVNERMHMMYAICSNLVDDASINAIVAISFVPGSWEQILAIREIPLPTQNSCIHRVHVVSEGIDAPNHTVVVSELSSSKLFQMKVERIRPLHFVRPNRTPAANTPCPSPMPRLTHALAAQTDKRRTALTR